MGVGQKKEEEFKLTNKNLQLNYYLQRVIMIEKNWKEIIKPSKLEVKEDSNSENTSTIIAESLDRG